MSIVFLSFAVDLFFRLANEAVALSLRPGKLRYAEHWKSSSVLSAALARGLFAARAAFLVGPLFFS